MKSVKMFLAAAAMIISTASMAQFGGGRRGSKMNPAEMKAKMSQVYQDSLGFSKDVADTAAGTKIAFMEKMRANFTPGQRPDMEAMKSVREEEQTQLKTLLGDDQFAKLEAWDKAHSMRGRGMGRPMRKEQSTDED